VLEVKELTDDLVPLVDGFLRNDPFVNAYALWDLHRLRNRTKFFLCMDERELKGLLLSYFSPGDVIRGTSPHHVIWLWGEENAVKELLDIPLPDKIVFWVFPEFVGIIKRKFSISSQYQLDFMLLRKGEECLYIRHEIRRLKPSDAYSLASLRKEKPSEREIEIAKIILESQIFYGIFSNSILASVASISVMLPHIWIIGSFYTRPEYRNKGFATSLASFLVKEGLKNVNHLGLYVRTDNYPAKHVYEKVGFKLYKRMYCLNYNIEFEP